MGELKRFLVFLCISLLLTAVCFGCANNKKQQGINTSSSRQPASSLEPSSIQETESISTQLRKFELSHPDFTVLDCAYTDTSSSGVTAAVTFCNSTGMVSPFRSGITFLSDRGNRSFLDLSSGDANLSFAENGKIAFVGIDTVSVALVNSETNEVTDFQIKYEYNPLLKMESTTTLSSKVRK